MDCAPRKPIAVQTVVLDQPPCCIEFSPESPSYFLVGTYNLKKADAASSSHGAEGEDQDESDLSDGRVKTQERDGSIMVFRILQNEIIHVQKAPQTSAILDLHFQPKEGKRSICAAVSSTATFAVFRLQADAGVLQPLSHLGTVKLPGVGDEVLFTSFCWHPTVPDLVAVTTTTGNVHVVRLGEGYQDCDAPSEPIIIHSLEAWHVAMSPHVTLSSTEPGPGPGCDGLGLRRGAFTIFSGGDDAMLRYMTCVLDEDNDPKCKGPVAHTPFATVAMKGHDAGVTAILPLPARCGDRELVVTGSYDDHIRLFSILPLHKSYGVRSAKLLAELNLGGGVWRVKLISLENNGGWKANLLVSCMHAGVKIVQIAQQAEELYAFSVLAEFEEHKSMNYGSDFLPGSGQENDTRFVSVSFYDRLLCFWKLDLRG